MTKRHKRKTEKWRKDNKLRIEVRPDKTKYEKHLTSLLKSWNKKQHDILIFCDPYFDQYDEEQFQEKIDFYNKTYNRRDVYFMGFELMSPPGLSRQGKQAKYSPRDPCF